MNIIEWFKNLFNKPKPNQYPALGINFFPYNPGMDRLYGLNLQWVRLPITNTDNLDRCRTIVNTLKSRGIKVLACITHKQSPFSIPNVFKNAYKYLGDSIWYEIGNELNHELTPGNKIYPVEYYGIINACHNLVPGAKLIHCGLAEVAGWQDWLSKFIACGGASLTQWWNMHCYSPNNISGIVNYLRRLSAKPIAITEFGCNKENKKVKVFNSFWDTMGRNKVDYSFVYQFDPNDNFGVNGSPAYYDAIAKRPR